MSHKVADVGSLSAGAKMATNASFLRGIANLQIQFSIICNMYHVIGHFLPKKQCFAPKEHFFCPESSKGA